MVVPEPSNRSSARLGRWFRSKAEPRIGANFVIYAKDVSEWASDVGRVWSYPENPVGGSVEDRDRAVAAYRHRAVAHAEHEIAVEMLARRPHHVRGYTGLYNPAGRCDGHRTH